MTGTALDTYLPYDAGAGANVQESQWQTLADPWLPVGIVAGIASELAVVQRAAGANMSVDVGTGEGRVKGMQGVSTSVKNLGVTANASGNPRVDLIVLRNDFTNNQMLVDILAGTAAANPVEPALTQNSAMWEEPLAAIDVASGAVSIATANIRDRRSFTRVHRQSRIKDPVRFATTAALAASTITGVKRVANANGALGAVDGITGAAGDRLLDKDHGTGSARGIWRIVDPGSASTPWRMERPYDADESADVAAGMYVIVNEGTANADTGWLLTTNDPITLGTTALTFTQFPGSISVTSANGEATGDVTLTANTTVDIISTSSLGIGTWLVMIGTAVLSPTAGTNVALDAVGGTATATISGVRGASMGNLAANSRTSMMTSFIATVTVAGTVKLQGYSATNNSTAEQNTPVGVGAKATGWTALKIA